MKIARTYLTPLVRVVEIDYTSLLCEASNNESEFGGNGGGKPAAAHYRIDWDDVSTGDWE